MKPYKPIAVFIALVLLPAARIRAQTTDYTYEFEATSGNSVYLNNSTLTIQDSSGHFSIIGWNLVNTDPSFGFTVRVNSTLPSTPTYTAGSPGSFSAQGLLAGSDITSATTTGFSGIFNITNYVGSGTIPQLSSLSTLFTVGGDYFAAQKTTGGSVYETDVPAGTWEYVSPVPEPETYNLLLAGIGATELLRRRLRIRIKRQSPL